MAITSAGYPKIGASDGQIDATEWATLAETLGADYGVVGSSSWVVTPVTTSGVARTVSISAGTGYGRGIYDVSTTPVQVQAPTLGTGTTLRWDTVVAHRDWTTPATTFTVLPGTGNANVAASRATSPGNVDDQPIALIRLESNTGFPTQVIDLRKWNAKSQYANDLRAIVDPDVGDMVADAGGARWQYTMVGGSLTRVRVGTMNRFQRTGENVTGIAAAAAQAPLSVVEIHGFWHGFTSPSGRSELSDTIVFDLPFSSLLDLQLSQIHKPPVASAPNFSEFSSTNTTFQAVWRETVTAGTAPSTERAFRWHATGVL